MEMSSGAVRQDGTARRPVRGPHGGWQKQEIDALRLRIDQAAQSGESLRSVFDQLALELGRKPNSIRNFYYAQIRAQGEPALGRALPFETFSQQEVEQLMENVLAARAQGMSVRACVRKLAGGDRTLMLRYQNKYRSTVRTRPELVRRVMDRLSEAGIPYVSPYGDIELETALPRMQRQARESGDAQLEQLFTSLEHLLDLALAPRGTGDTPPGDDVQRRADRLGAQCDMLRIALDDQQIRTARLKSEAQGMASLVREYIALPADGRSAQADLFCQQAAQRLSAMECALMQEDETAFAGYE